MNLNYLKSNIESLIKHRNALLVISFGLLLSNLCLVIKLLKDDTRTIVVPPTINKSFWVESDFVAPEYLEEMSLFLTHLILDISPGSAKRQRDVALRYVTPKFYNVLKKRLEREEEFLRKEQISLSFKPTQILVDSKKMQVEITGVMNHYVASERIKNMEETYYLTFVYKGSKLHLDSFKLKGGDGMNRLPG